MSADRVGDGESFLRDVRRPAVAEIAIERVAEIDRPALGDHRARHVRSTDRAARRLLEHRREFDAHAELVEPHRRCARRASGASRAARRAALPSRACRTGAGRGCAFRTSPSTALSSTPGTTRTPSSAPVGGRFGDAVERVVIGERDRGEADALRLANDVRRRARAVGRRRVRVQVDERLGASGRRAGTRRRHAE